MSKLAK